jgi:hypothetical protein
MTSLNEVGQVMKTDAKQAKQGKTGVKDRGQVATHDWRIQVGTNRRHG